MKKKIKADLTSLAHQILQLKDKDDVSQLQAVAKELYEKLTVLVFTEKHFSDIKPTAGNREVEDKLQQVFEDAQRDVQSVSHDVEQVMEDAQQEVSAAFTSNDLSDLFVPEEDNREEMELPGISTIQKMVVEMPDEAPATPHNEEKNNTHPNGKLPNRYRDSFSTNSLNDLEVPEDDDREEMELPGISTIHKMVEEMPDKQSAPKEKGTKTYDKNDLEQLTADFQTMPVFERKTGQLTDSNKPKSLNSSLNKGLKIGMNDRIGFVKHLFNGNSQDYDRVISQLNTKPDYETARTFLEQMIKPDYNNWEGKESYESRFLEIVERNFQ
jgi:hypothetical protein